MLLFEHKYMNYLPYPKKVTAIDPPSVG